MRIEMKMTTGMVVGMMGLMAWSGHTQDASAPSDTVTDKTFVAWVSPADMEQQGSGVVALMQGVSFDALVLGEILRGRWMPGSDNFRRTEKNQAAWPAETAAPGQQVQIAVVYAGNHITVYRDGQPYADYEAGGRETFQRRGDVLIGARYRAGAGSETGFFNGDIEEVRLYDRALAPDQIKALTPGKPGDVKPWGIWTFEGGSVQDGMNHYPKGYLLNGATIVDGKLRLDGNDQYMLVTVEPVSLQAAVQAGFFTPRRVGQIWDTWAYFHEGRYYLYYLAGHFNRWDGHELALSEDGVHWTQQGVMIKPRAGVTWMGTGHIWKSPDFGRNHTWVINYSEWFGDKQDIMFATSSNLVNWTKVDEKYRFVQDTRWYREKGRWDCIDTVQRPDGSLYGYFTADPDPGKVKYRPCGFGFAESKDGITWTALPPVEGDISGEFGGIQKIGEKYYIIISEGRVAVGDRPEGPFYSQKKNPNVFGHGCDIYFPRFFHNAPGGPLVNHFYQNGPVHAAPLKAVDVGADGMLRLKWWSGNDKLKATPVETKLVGAGTNYAGSLRLFDKKLDLGRAHVIEGAISDVLPQAKGEGRYGLFFDHGNGMGHCLLFASDAVRFGEIKADGSGLKVLQTSSRDMDFGSSLLFRLVIQGDMMELYVNDYLMNLKRVKCNGQMGIMGGDSAGSVKDIRVWQSR